MSSVIVAGSPFEVAKPFCRLDCVFAKIVIELAKKQRPCVENAVDSLRNRVAADVWCGKGQELLAERPLATQRIEQASTCGFHKHVGAGTVLSSGRDRMAGADKGRRL